MSELPEQLSVRLDAALRRIEQLELAVARLTLPRDERIAPPERTFDATLYGPRAHDPHRDAVATVEEFRADPKRIMELALAGTVTVVDESGPRMTICRTLPPLYEAALHRVEALELEVARLKKPKPRFRAQALERDLADALRDLAHALPGEELQDDDERLDEVESR